jgi:hypothetical protein
MLLLLPILAAVTTIDPGSSAKFLGWTADGHHVVWTASDRESSADEESGGMSSTLDESASIAIVHDIRRGDRKVFLIKYTAHTARGRKAGTLKKKYASAGAPAAFDSWKKANPLTMTADRKSKTGTANIAVKLDEGSSAWKGSSIGWTVENSAKVSLSVTCGKVTNTGDLIEQEMSATYQPEWKATPYWDPAGRHVAFLMQEAVAKTMRGPEGGRSSIVLVPCGTRISVVAPASAIAEQDKVAAALEKIGYNVVDLGPAKAKRAATVVYASAKHTAEAEALAKKIPGGATVEKLTWKPKADIVVAVGDSAK